MVGTWPRRRPGAQEKGGEEGEGVCRWMTGDPTPVSTWQRSALSSVCGYKPSLLTAECEVYQNFLIGWIFHLIKNCFGDFAVRWLLQIIFLICSISTCSSDTVLCYPHDDKHAPIYNFLPILTISIFLHTMFFFPSFTHILPLTTSKNSFVLMK